MEEKEKRSEVRICTEFSLLCVKYLETNKVICLILRHFCLPCRTCHGKQWSYLTLLADSSTYFYQNKNSRLHRQLKRLVKIQTFFAAWQLSEKTQEALLPL